MGYLLWSCWQEIPKDPPNRLLPNLTVRPYCWRYLIHEETELAMNWKLQNHWIAFRAVKDVVDIPRGKTESLTLTSSEFYSNGWPCKTCSVTHNSDMNIMRVANHFLAGVKTPSIGWNTDLEPLSGWRKFLHSLCTPEKGFTVITLLNGHNSKMT